MLARNKKIKLVIKCSSFFLSKEIIDQSINPNVKKYCKIPTLVVNGIIPKDIKQINIPLLVMCFILSPNIL